MKTPASLFLVLFLTAFLSGTYAQIGNIVVFAPKGEKFTLYFGSNMKNHEPASRVEADNPGGPSFKVKIVLADPSEKEISKLVFNKPHSTMYFKVEKNGKGVFTIESVSSEWTDESVSKDNGAPPTPAEHPSPEQKGTNPEKPATDESAKAAKATGCNNPMSEPDFNAELVSISARPFEPMQLSAAKKTAEAHCLTVSQVVRVIYIFDSESSRLSFAKFAYDFTSDRNSYGEVKDALHSEKSKNELDKFLASKTK
jgi:hypothetical protein